MIQWLPSVHFRQEKQVDVPDMENLNSEEPMWKEILYQHFLVMNVSLQKLRTK